jgi:methyl-accepting chemotaxis protein
MNWMNNIKVAYKILILAVIASIAMLTIGYTGYSYMQKASADMDNMYYQKLQAIKALGDVRLNVRGVQTVVLENALEDGSKTQAALKEKEDGFDQAWAQYEKALSFKGISEEIRTKADAVNPVWQDYRKTAEEIVQLKQSGQSAESAALYNSKGKPGLERLRSQLDELQETADKNADVLNQQNTDDTTASITAMLIKIIVAFIVLVVSSLWIARELTRPVHAVIEGLCETERRRLPGGATFYPSWR